MTKTVEDRILSRARKGYAAAVSRRVDACEATVKAQARLRRAEKGARGRYMESLYLAEIADLAGG